MNPTYSGGIRDNHNGRGKEGPLARKEQRRDRDHIEGNSSVIRGIPHILSTTLLLNLETKISLTFVLDT